MSSEHDNQDAKDLIHELQVAYTEVEMQCEELKQTRNSLEELNAKYKALFYSAPAGYLVLDRNKKIMEINSAGVSIIGNERNTVVGRDFSGYVSGGSLRAFRELFDGISENSPRQQGEIQLHNRGSELWVNLHISILEKSENFPLTYVAVITDLREQKEREKLLADTRKEYSDILETAQSIIAKMDSRGRLSYINRYGLDFFGYARDELIGKHVVGTIMAETDSTGRANTLFLQELLRRPDEYWETETENTRSDGSTVWLHWRNKALTDDEGKITGILGIGHDVTEQREARRVLERDKEVLEELVEERTEQLIQARKEAMRRKRLQELGRLSASVAHELRRPLASLQLSLYNIRKKNKNQSLEKQLNNCEEKIFEGEQIINNLLKSSSLNSPVFQEVNLFQLITDCIGDLRESFAKSNIQLQQDLTALQKLKLEADPVQIKEVMYNILQNAYEAAPEENGRILVQGIYTDEYIGFTVTDNDNGIPEDELDKITEPFYTTKHRGIGLGLTVAREIITMHEGKLKIESAKGVGTTVTVTFPRNTKL